jgi:hypothetical protein
MQAFLHLRAEVSTFFDFQQVFPFLALAIILSLFSILPYQ